MVKILGKKLAYLVIVVILTALTVFMAGCAPEEYEVEVQADPEEAGEIKGAGTYEEGQEVILEAEADENYVFVGWEIDDDQLSTSEQYSFELKEDKQITAVFDKEEETQEEGQVDIGLDVFPSPDSVEVSGDGNYDKGEEVTITAEPEEGYEFINWMSAETVDLSTDSTYSFEAEESKEITAVVGKSVLADFKDGKEIDDARLAKELWDFDLFITPPEETSEDENEEWKFNSDDTVYIESKDFDLRFYEAIYAPSSTNYFEDVLGVESEKVGFGKDHLVIADEEKFEDKTELGSEMGKTTVYQFRDISEGSNIKLEVSPLVKKALDFDTEGLMIKVD